jgi:peptidyl-prolyl cis-trans isomerase B (cyclophilin B)
MTDPVVPPAAPVYQPVPVAPKTNTLAIVGFILAFFVSVAGIVVSAIALRQIKDTGEGGRGLAIGGIIVGIVVTVLYVIIILFSVLVPLLFLGSACSSGLCNQ